MNTHQRREAKLARRKKRLAKRNPRELRKHKEAHEAILAIGYTRFMEFVRSTYMKDNDEQTQ